MAALEQRIRDRLAVDTQQAQRELRAAGRDEAAALKALDKARAKHTEKVAKAVEAATGHDDGMDFAEISAREACDGLNKALGQLVKAAMAVREAQARSATLADPTEFDRRLTEAREFAAMQGPTEMSTKEAAELVLLRAGKELHTNEITRQALEAGIVKVRGRTPSHTVSSMLATAARAGDTFVRVSPGVFDLRERRAKAKS